MCHSCTSTCLIKHLFQREHLTKSVPFVTNLKQSLLITQQTFFLIKTSFVLVFRRRLSSLSSEDVFRTFSRCLDQEEYIRLSFTPSEDALVKTNIGLGHIPSKRLQDVLRKHLQDIFKTF